MLALLGGPPALRAGELGGGPVLTTEGLPIGRWQTKPLPHHRLFKDRQEFPVEADICARRLSVGHSRCPIGPPHTRDTMRRIAAVFEKILVTEGTAFRRMVSGR
ncbi:hypothetical protein NKG94_22685 [Micromonospora sp. M12]